MRRVCDKSNKGAIELLKGYGEYVIPEKSVENPFNAYVLNKWLSDG